VVPIAAPSPQEKAEHWLRRFWRRLPARGERTIFDRSCHRSCHGRVLVERVEGFAAEDE
jgi:polyphosphate kinase 2 (PPK2 family)